MLHVCRSFTDRLHTLWCSAHTDMAIGCKCLASSLKVCPDELQEQLGLKWPTEATEQRMRVRETWSWSARGEARHCRHHCCAGCGVALVMNGDQAQPRPKLRTLLAIRWDGAGVPVCSRHDAMMPLQRDCLSRPNGLWTACAQMQDSRDRAVSTLAAGRQWCRDAVPLHGTLRASACGPCWA